MNELEGDRESEVIEIDSLGLDLSFLAPSARLVRPIIDTAKSQSMVNSVYISKVDNLGVIVDEWLIERGFGGLDGLTRFDSKTMGIPPNGFILIEAA